MKFIFSILLMDVIIVSISYFYFSSDIGNLYQFQENIKNEKIVMYKRFIKPSMDSLKFLPIIEPNEFIHESSIL